MGAEQYNRLESAVEALLMHMLTWDHQSERRARSWTLTIIEQRKRIEKILKKNPSLKSRVSEAIEDGYDLGRVRAAREMRRKLHALPATCPYDWAAIMTCELSLDGD